MIVHDVEVEGNRVDVRIADGLVADIAPRIRGDGLDGHGGALLPGLHDHHIHLMALAATHSSVDCRGGLEALRTAPPGPWVRGVGFDGSVDRHVLDALVPDRPTRVQHRSGALWMLNTPALDLVELDASTDVERDKSGRATGRLWRYDARLRRSLAGQVPNLSGLAEDLLRLGLTSVTDATPDLDRATVGAFAALPIEVTALGDPSGTAPRKLVIPDHDMPSFPELCQWIAEIHGSGRPVAVHCVTRASLLLTLAALDDVGRLRGDRIEHAAVVPDPALLRGLRVVTQPGFIADRGDKYRLEVDHDDLPHLYRYGSLLSAGVDTLPSSDAPYGPVDPWAVLRAARDRRTVSGHVLGPTERVSASTGLEGYLRDADARPRRVEQGAPAALCLLRCNLAEALDALDADVVRATFVPGREGAISHA